MNYTSEFANRLQQVRSKISSFGIDAILVSNPFTRRYISGFTGSAGYLFINQNVSLLATDFRYTEQAEAETDAWEIAKSSYNNQWLCSITIKTDTKRLGFEGSDLTFATYKRIKKTLTDKGIAVDLIDVSDLTKDLRSIKGTYDLTNLLKAIKAGDHCFDYVSSQLKAGQTEREIANMFKRAALNANTEGVSFETIVASGPNAARPHHSPSERIIREGETVVIDCGVKVNGYCSDLTRTLILGSYGEKLRNVYNTVYEAQSAAINGITAGITGHQADGIARTVIEKAGYGNNFGHSLGHGLGLEVHESPHIGPNSTDQIAEGMVFTVEPGIYIPGWGGVRIEDVVIIENGVCKILSNSSIVNKID